MMASHEITNNKSINKQALRRLKFAVLWAHEISINNYVGKGLYKMILYFVNNLALLF